jgi:hypothetical protein
VDTEEWDEMIRDKRDMPLDMYYMGVWKFCSHQMLCLSLIAYLHQQDSILQLSYIPTLPATKSWDFCIQKGLMLCMSMNAVKYEASILTWTVSKDGLETFSDLHCGEIFWC